MTSSAPGPAPVSPASVASAPVAGAYRPQVYRVRGRFNGRGFLSLLGRELLRLKRMAMLLVVAPALSAALYFIVFSFGLAEHRGTPEGDALLLGLVPGLAMLSLLMQSASSPAFSLVFSKLEGALIDLLMAPLGAPELVGAFVLSGMVAGLVSGGAVWLGFVLFWHAPIAQPGVVLLFAGLGALLMATLGMLVGLISAKWDHLSAAMTFVLLPLTYMSGLFAPVGAMPGLLGRLARANPIFHAVDGVRTGFLGAAAPPQWAGGDLGTDFVVLAVTNVVLLALTLALVARGWRLRA